MLSTPVCPVTAAVVIAGTGLTIYLSRKVEDWSSALKFSAAAILTVQAAFFTDGGLGTFFFHDHPIPFTVNHGVSIFCSGFLGASIIFVSSKIVEKRRESTKAKK
jgi:hypothetical protein